MWEDIILMAVGNGLWAVLSCILLSYLLKDSKKREAKFTCIIEDLALRLKVVGKIQEDVKQLTGRVEQFVANAAMQNAASVAAQKIVAAKTSARASRSSK